MNLIKENYNNMEYNEGIKAWFDNLTINDCPYVISSKKCRDWCRGWKDSEYKYNLKTT